MPRGPHAASGHARSHSCEREAPVRVLNLHSRLQEACDLHPTSRWTPSQGPPARAVCAESQEHEVPHLQIISQCCSACILYSGRRCSGNTISSQVCSAHEQQRGHNEHNQLTNPKHGLFMLNGQRCWLNPAGFGFLFFREHTLTTIDLGCSQTMRTRMQSISLLITMEQ